MRILNIIVLPFLNAFVPYVTWVYFKDYWLMWTASFAVIVVWYCPQFIYWHIKHKQHDRTKEKEVRRLR